MLDEVFSNLEFPRLLSKCRTFIEDAATWILQQNLDATVRDLAHALLDSKTDMIEYIQGRHDLAVSDDVIDAIRIRIEKSIGNYLRITESDFYVLAEACTNELSELIFTSTHKRPVYTNTGDNAFHLTDRDNVMECYSFSGTSFVLVAGVTPGMSEDEQLRTWSELTDCLLHGPSWCFNKQLVVLCDTEHEELSCRIVSDIIKSKRKSIITEGIVLSVWSVELDANGDVEHIAKTLFDYSASGKGSYPVTPVIDPTNVDKSYEHIQAMFMSREQEMEDIFPSLFQLSRVEEKQLSDCSLTIQAIFIRLSKERAKDGFSHETVRDTYCFPYRFNATVLRAVLLDYKEDRERNVELLRGWIWDADSSLSPSEFMDRLTKSTQESESVELALNSLDAMLDALGNNSASIRCLASMTKEELTNNRVDSRTLSVLHRKCEHLAELVSDISGAIDKSRSELEEKGA